MTDFYVSSPNVTVNRKQNYIDLFVKAQRGEPTEGATGYRARREQAKRTRQELEAPHHSPRIVHQSSPSVTLSEEQRYNNITTSNPPLDWAKKVALSTGKTVSSAGFEIFSFAKRLLSSDFTALEDEVDEVEVGPSRKKRKVEMAEEVNNEAPGDKAIPGSLPMFYENVIDSSNVEQGTEKKSEISERSGKPEMSQIHRTSDHSNLLKSTLLKASIPSHKTKTKSSGGLFTPTSSREPQRPNQLPNPPPVQSNRNPVYSGAKLFQNVRETTYEHVSSPVIPNVTYGTGFFLNKNRSKQLRQAQSQSQIQAADNESYENFAALLREAFKGTAYQSSIPTSANIPSVSSSPEPRSLTPLGKISYKDPRVLSKLQRRRELLLTTNHEYDTTSATTTRLPTTFLPSHLSPEKVRKYNEFHKRTQNLHEEIERLKIDTDEFKKPLEPNQLKQVEDYWYNPKYRRDGGRVIGTAFRVDLQVRDVQSLADGSWLNDNVIDFYLSMATEKANNSTKIRSFAFSTHFYSKLDSASGGYKAVSRWAKRKNIDVTALDYVFVPINLGGSHWCLAVINNKDSTFEYYDSMSNDGNRCIAVLCDYMILEADRIHPGNHQKHVDKYTSYTRVPRCPCPQQRNGYDCGVFTCTNVEFMSNGRALTYRQADMKLIRRNMAYKVISRALKKE